MGLFEEYKDTLAGYLGLAKKPTRITKGEFDQLNPPLQNDPLAALVDQSYLRNSQTKYYKYIFPWQKFFGYSKNLHPFYNFLIALYYIPFNTIRLCALLPLTFVYLLFNTADNYLYKQQGGWLYTIFTKGFVGFLCALTSFLLVIPMTLIKHFSPENLYNAVERTFSLIINAIRFIYYIPFLLSKAVNFLLAKIYPYDENIQKSGFRKVGALFIGLFRFAFYLPEFAMRAILFPFGPASIEFKIFSFYSSFSPVGNTQEEWQNASEKIFGTGSIVQGFNTFMGWFGKTLGGTISVAGWSVISYFAFPAVVSNICNWVGITLPQIILGLPSLSPAGTIASTISATLVFIGIGISELMGVEPQKNQKLLKQKTSFKPIEPKITYISFPNFCTQLLNTKSNTQKAITLMTNIEALLTHSEKTSWTREMRDEYQQKRSQLEHYEKCDENLHQKPSKNTVQPLPQPDSTIERTPTEDLSTMDKMGISVLRTSHHRIFTEIVVLYTLLSTKFKQVQISQYPESNAIFSLYFDYLHGLIQETQVNLLSPLWGKIQKPQSVLSRLQFWKKTQPQKNNEHKLEHKEENVAPIKHPDPALFDKYNDCFQATLDYLQSHKNTAEQENILDKVEDLNILIAGPEEDPEEKGLVDEINDGLMKYGLTHYKPPYNFGKITNTGNDILKLENTG